MPNSRSSAARRPSLKVRPNPQSTRPQSARNEYRQAAPVSSVSQDAIEPQAMLTTPRPISIAASAWPASTDRRPSARLTTTVASTGPMKAIQTMGAAVRTSSSADSGSTRSALWQPADGARDHGRQKARPHGGPSRGESCGGGQCQGEKRDGREQDLRLVAGKEPGPSKSRHRED